MTMKERLGGWLEGWRLPAAALAFAAAGAAAFGPARAAPASSLPRLELSAVSRGAAGQALSGAIAGAAGAFAEPMADEGGARSVAPEPPRAGSPAAPRKIVRSASLAVEVPDEPRARSLAKAAAARAGATLEADDASGQESRSATLSFKVAPERFEELVAALETLGRVRSRSLSTENLGAEYVDLRSRLENMRRVEERLHQLLAFRTSKLADVLAVEKELERVGGEIETTEGRMKYIDALAAASTVTLRLCEPERDQPRGGVVADARNALVGAVDTFVNTGLALLKLTSWLAALALWVVPVSLILWRAKRRAGF